jgi:hypothetical protein
VCTYVQRYLTIKEAGILWFRRDWKADSVGWIKVWMIRLCGELCLFDITIIFPLMTDGGHLAVMTFASRTGMASFSPPNARCLLMTGQSNSCIFYPGPGPSHTPTCAFTSRGPVPTNYDPSDSIVIQGTSSSRTSSGERGETALELTKCLCRSVFGSSDRIHHYW